jgi:hypothetical protein
MSPEEYEFQLEDALMDAASSFGGNASPALARWLQKHAQLLASIRRKHGKPVGAIARFAGGTNEPQG